MCRNHHQLSAANLERLDLQNYIIENWFPNFSLKIFELFSKKETDWSLKHHAGLLGGIVAADFAYRKFADEHKWDSALVGRYPCLNVVGRLFAAFLGERKSDVVGFVATFVAKLHFTPVDVCNLEVFLAFPREDSQRCRATFSHCVEVEST